MEDKKAVKFVEFATVCLKKDVHKNSYFKPSDKKRTKNIFLS
jgi:hypothetical protein